MIGYSRYDEPYYEEENDYVHAEEIEEIRSLFKDIVHSLYITCDLEELDAEVKYLCKILEVPQPTTALAVQNSAAEEPILDLADRMLFHCQQINKIINA